MVWVLANHFIKKIMGHIGQVQHVILVHIYATFIKITCTLNNQEIYIMRKQSDL